MKVQAWDPVQNIPKGPEDKRLVLVTDMTMIVKENDDDSRDLFVQSIVEGAPLANAEVSLLGKNGLAIFSDRTDNEGHLSVPPLKDFKNDRQPAAYLVRNGNDLCFLPYQKCDRQLNYSRFDTGGITSWPKNNLSAFLFSDRDIYRPGEMLHAGIIIKERFAKEPPLDLPLEAILTDPRGAVLLRQRKTIPDNNICTFEYLFAQSALSGQYHLQLYFGDQERSESLLGSHYVQVAEFKPDRLKMQVELASDETSDNSTLLGWISPQALKAKIKLWNLFGMPAAAHRIAGKMIIAPCPLSFSQYKDYNFVDPWHDPKKPIKYLTEELPAISTDSNGEGGLAFNLNRFAKSAYLLSFIAEGFEGDSGCAVTAETSALVSPLEHLVGYKAEGNLNFLKQHSKQRVHIIAIDPQLKRIALNNLHAQILAYKNVSGLVKKPNGTYEYRTMLQEVPVSSETFEVNSNGSYFNLPTDGLGEFAVLIKDVADTPLCKIPFSVIGLEGELQCNKSDLVVKLGRSTYDPGETIEVHITAPFTGSGLITIERDKVYAYKWFNTDEIVTIQNIALPKDFQGDGYINVTFVRSWDSEDIYIAPLSCAVVPFDVSREPQKLHLQLQVPPIVKSGDSFQIQHQSNKPAQMIVYAVDEGILQLSDYQTPDPLAHFFPKHALKVTTSQTADLILPKHTNDSFLSTPGGDNIQKLLVKNLNPFKHTKEQAAVFCSGIIDTSPTPQVVTCRMPDHFNGKLRVMAVAANSSALGSIATETLVQSDYIINTHASSYIAPGDTMTVTATIANCLSNDNPEKEIEVRLKASQHFDVIGPSSQVLTVPCGRQANVAFEIKALDVLGEGMLTFEVVPMENPKASVQREVTLSVRPATAYQNRLISGCEHSATKTIALEGEFYEQHLSLKAGISTNPLLLAHGLQNYIEASPHNSTVTILSSAMVQLALADKLQSYPPKDDVLGIYNSNLQLLRERQTELGGFCSWPSRHDSDIEVSLFAADFLLEAQLEGYPVPTDLYKSVMYYLESFVQKDIQNLNQARKQAHAVYLLTRSGLVTTNYLINLQTFLMNKHKGLWEKELTGAYIAATYLLLQSKDKAKQLIGCYHFQEADSKEIASQNRLLSHAQYLNLLVRHFPETLKTISGDAIAALTQSLTPDQLHTLSAASCAQALSAFSRVANDQTGNPLKITAVSSDGRETVFKPLKNKDMPVEFDPLTTNIKFYNPRKQLYFYQIHQSGFDKKIPLKPKSKGLEIAREYCDNSGKSIGSCFCGDKIKVHVSARTLDKQTASHVAIVDLLPAGFSVVPNSISQDSCEYVDIRDDRIIFYCGVEPEVTKLNYCLQANSKGDFGIAPLYAYDLNRPTVRAQGIAGRIKVEAFK